MKNGRKRLKLNLNLVDILENKMESLIYKIGLVLAVALLVCLFPMPYGYYILVRFVAMVVFGCMVLIFYKEGKKPLSVIAGSLALLFQPFFKIVIGKTMWSVVDLIVAVALVLLWYINRKQSL